MIKQADRQKIGRIAGKICRYLEELLDKNESHFEKRERCLMVNGGLCTYYITINRIDASQIVFHEMIIPDKEKGEISFNWQFLKEEDQWTVHTVDKNGTPISHEILFNEVDESYERLRDFSSDSSSQSNIFEVPTTEKSRGYYYLPIVKKGYNALFPLIGAAVLVFGLFITLFINSLQYNRMTSIVDRLDSAIFYSAETNDRAVTALVEQIEVVNSQIKVLEAEVQREKEAFEFSKKNTAMGVRRQADELPRSQRPRKKAYEYIAQQIENSGTYGEIIYQMSRLPKTNSQASTMMITEKSRVTPIAAYKPVFTSMVYPVRIDGEKNSGEDFIITSGFSENRLSPLGTGGYHPHRALDLININNILMVETDSALYRGHENPGAVVASLPGTISRVSYDTIYGWNIEVRHELTPEIKEMFPRATGVSTFYAHLKDKGHWQTGAKVASNEKLGDIGNTGISTGPHLHFELRIYHNRGEFWTQMGRYDKIESYMMVE